MITLWQKIAGEYAMIMIPVEFLKDPTFWLEGREMLNVKFS